MHRSLCFVVLASLLGPPLLAGEPTRAVAVIQPLQDSGVSGRVTFTHAPGGVKVSVRISGLTPGRHGFHIHEYGDCSAADGTSAGSHFNPSGEPHAGPAAARRHTGDLGNVEADAQGVAELEYVDARASFTGQHSILGRGVIVHVKADDLETQPTGDAGGRLGCGVIGVVAP